jgi:hypothetical protein
MPRSAAKQEDVPTAKPMPLTAPHAADQSLADTPNERVYLTIDAR